MKNEEIRAFFEPQGLIEQPNSWFVLKIRYLESSNVVLNVRLPSKLNLFSEINAWESF